MKKILLLSISLIVICLLPACTENARARSYGGTETVELEANRKVMNVTWKETDLWILTRPMLETDSAETIIFKEKSNLGISDGTILLIEKKISK